MARVKLSAGDRVCYRSPAGLKLRAVVDPYLSIKERGEEQVIPVRRRKEVIWKKRSELRKLP